MNDIIQHHFYVTLLVLALDAEEQVRVTEPGVVSIDIYEDAIHWPRLFVESASVDLSSDVTSAISVLITTLEKIPSEVFKLPNLESMQHPAWLPLRQQAQCILKLLGWSIHEVKPFIRQDNGTYIRRQDF